MKNTLEIENNCIEKGYKLIAGVDEAGRGPLAGPVVSACVIMPLDDIIEGVDDSKKLSEKKRDFLFDKIIEKAIAYKISVVSEKVIDEINILNATKMSMKECIEGMEIKPDIVLVDAVKLEMEVPCVPIIHGDALSYSIAAASILAKVSRDRIMQEYDKVYPQYLFAKHKGYGTKMHIEAIKEHGSCEIHRKTFITRFI
ncbi:MAG: ribonuclease HII [Clostridia bacterium]|nr:ribonuclease HII [Clostridia bacterium]MBR2874428.1 ribonuclease HII [Clostridia bacterium]